MEHKISGKAGIGKVKKSGNKKKQKQRAKKKLNGRKESRKQKRKEKKAKKHEYILSKTHAAEKISPANKMSTTKAIPSKKVVPTKPKVRHITATGRKPRQSRTLTIKTIADKAKEEQKALEEAKIAKLEEKYFGGRYSSSEDESSDENDHEDVQNSDDDGQGSSNVSDSESWDKNLTMEQLKDKMAKTRRKRLLEENEEEDRYINSLSKKLKLNKKAIIPESFRSDGLDYLLEVCEPKMKKGDDKLNEETETSAYLKEKRLKKLKELTEGDKNKKSKRTKDADSDEGEGESDLDSDFDDMDFSDEPDSGENEDIFDDDEEDNNDAKAAEFSDRGDSDISDLKDSEEESNPDAEEEEYLAEKTKLSKSDQKLKLKAEGKGNDCWEDIYGRLRDKDGNVINKISGNEMTGKYVPPGKRDKPKSNSKSLAAIEKSLKGLLNRLGEANMHSIAAQVEQLYMTNSRNEMNECLLDLMCSALVRTVQTPERVVLEHVMLIAILHANVGTEIGAFFVQSFVQRFDSLYKTTTVQTKNGNSEADESKELENLMLLTCFMFHFKIVDSTLIYDLLQRIGETFTGKDIELILTVLRSIGFRLRKENPIRLKELILLLQSKAAETKLSQTSSRVKFMLEILLAIRNNNMTKIPNYDPSFGEHLLKIIKTHLHKGTYISELKISLQDLLNADAKGRWWIVGSAWSNAKDNSDDKPAGNSSAYQVPGLVVNDKLLAKAKSLGMNTEIRKNIFCILMTAEDYVDAFEKLMHLGLKNQVEREIMHVVIYCCLQEKAFNPYYGLLLTKLSTVERRILLTIQYTIWDRLKDLSILPKTHLKNLSQLLVHLINGKVLPITVLKIIDFTDMDEVKLEFLRNTLTGILLQDNVENLQEIFTKLGSSSKFSLFRESLKLFLLHFMLKSKDNVASITKIPSLTPDKMKLLTARVSIVDRIMTTIGQGHVQF